VRSCEQQNTYGEGGGGEREVATKDEVEDYSKTKQPAEIMPFRVLYTLFTNALGQ
jgi:hypothetical protein